MEVSMIQLTGKALDAKREELESYNGKLKNLIKDLDQAEQQLKSMWDGEAADAYNRTYMAQRPSFDNFSELVTKYSNAIALILNAYARSENENVMTASTRSFK